MLLKIMVQIQDGTSAKVLKLSKPIIVRPIYSQAFAIKSIIKGHSKLDLDLTTINHNYYSPTILTAFSQCGRCCCKNTFLKSEPVKL